MKSLNRNKRVSGDGVGCLIRISYKVVIRIGKLQLCILAMEDGLRLQVRPEI